jgi:hypothetical protein
VNRKPPFIGDQLLHVPSRAAQYPANGGLREILESLLAFSQLNPVRHLLGPIEAQITQKLRRLYLVAPMQAIPCSRGLLLIPSAGSPSHEMSKVRGSTGQRLGTGREQNPRQIVGQ